MSVHCSGCGKKLRNKSADCITCHPELRRRGRPPDAMQRIRRDRELLRPLDALVRERSCLT